MSCILLHGLTDTLLCKFQSVQNATARLMTDTRRRDHITPVLRQLHWLPILEHVKFKVACLVRQSLSEQVPLNLAHDSCLLSDRRSLRSADVPICMVARTFSIDDDRTFTVAEPRLWNSFQSSCTIRTSSTDCSDDS